MQLEQLVERIEQAFGEALPFTEQPLADGDRDALARVFGDEGYQSYLQDQVNRQIIRDFLTNAVVLGFLPPQQLESLSATLATPEYRAALSLQMLMSPVEQAQELLARGAPEPLERLRPGPDAPPHIRLIQS